LAAWWAVCAAIAAQRLIVERIPLAKPVRETCFAMIHRRQKKEPMATIADADCGIENI
jgi:hypothetical protein